MFPCCYQVHVATGHDGRKLAVKVQHSGLRETATADIATISFIVRAVRYFFPVSGAMLVHA
jgi:aarF domain-containing kinase